MERKICSFMVLFKCVVLWYFLNLKVSEIYSMYVQYCGNMEKLHISLGELGVGRKKGIQYDTLI